MDYPFVMLCIMSLQLKTPVEFHVRAKAKKETADCAGLCNTYIRKGKIYKFVITLNLDVIYGSKYSMQAVIAHELIHACQMEHGFFNEGHHHDNKFQSLAKHLHDLLSTAGYKIEPLFDPKTDNT